MSFENLLFQKGNFKTFSLILLSIFWIVFTTFIIWIDIPISTLMEQFLQGNVPLKYTPC